MCNLYKKRLKPVDMQLRLEKRLSIQEMMRHKLSMYSQPSPKKVATQLCRPANEAKQKRQPHPIAAECQGNIGSMCHTNHLLRLLVVVLLVSNKSSADIDIAVLVTYVRTSNFWLDGWYSDGYPTVDRGQASC